MPLSAKRLGPAAGEVVDEAGKVVDEALVAGGFGSAGVLLLAAPTGGGTRRAACDAPARESGAATRETEEGAAGDVAVVGGRNAGTVGGEGLAIARLAGGFPDIARDNAPGRLVEGVTNGEGMRRLDV